MKSYLTLALLLTFAGCSHQLSSPQVRAPEQYVSDPGSVAFDIVPIPNNSGSSQWMATYNEDGELAKFIIDLGPTRPIADGKPDLFDSRVGEGRLLSQPGSNSTALLAKLQKALEATKLPIKPRRANTLPFTFVNQGGGWSKVPNRGFFLDPPGNWTATKIFIGEGDNEAQLFLNINPVLRKGEFAIKDSDYGDLALSYLAKVL